MIVLALDPYQLFLYKAGVIIFAAFVNASISNLFAYMIDPNSGSPLSSYLILFRKLLGNPPPGQEPFIYKISGGCTICTNVWINMLSFLPIVWLSHFPIDWEIGFWFIALPAISNSALIRLIR